MNQEQRWSLGEVFVLRHAGFPFDWMEELGLPPEVEALCQSLLVAEDQLIAAAVACTHKRAGQLCEEALRQGREPPKPAKADAAYAGALTRWREAHQQFDAAFRTALEPLRAKLVERARDPKVQEAVFLSAPNMYANVWTRYLNAGGKGENADARRAERQVYTYLQRFCAKNETTSFFGPMGYGEIEPSADDFRVERVPEAQRRRRTFHAFWVVQELGKLIARDKGLRPLLPVRRNPMFQIAPEKASCVPLGLEVPLQAAAHALLSALDTAGRSLTDVATVLGQPLEQVERTALPLFKGALLLRSLPFLADDLEAFTHLREAVRALPEVPAREAWLEKLERLEAQRADFEAGDLPQRRAVLPRWEALFTELTGQPARRGEGQMYMDRYVFYEEAASGFALRVGEGYAQKLAAQLSPGLELSAAYGERVQENYRREVREKLGGVETDRVDFLTYAMKLRPTQVGGSQFSPVPPLSLPGSGAELNTALTPSLAGASAPGGRFSLPDVCLEAATPEAASRGAVTVLLARVHHHLLLWSWLFSFYGNRERVKSMAARWMAREPTASGLVGLAIGRRNKGFYRFPGREVAYTPADLLTQDASTLAASQLDVRVSGDGPSLVGPGGEALKLYLPLADFSTYPPFAALAHPLVLHAPIVSTTAHTPRLTVGDAIYQRARWELTVPQLKKLNGPALYLEAQRLRRAHAFPRFVYARTPTERKPCLIDFSSLFALELLRHLVPDEGQVRLEEMYPTPEGLWLQDERGRYTCELRMQAVRG